MNEFKGTPGPWGFSDKAALGPVVIRSQNLMEIATVAVVENLMSNCGHPVTEKLANADLITAAPELLEALKYAVEVLDSEYRLRVLLGTDWMDEAKTAIKKALGDVSPL